MNIRPATPKDKPAIIELLRKSLGESTIPKSEALWNWKHEENPFGQSFVLLAEENEKLIGLRAFMQWKWQWDQKTYRTIRAVDTATHPDHQGKGIFKKLTLDQLQRCKQEGIAFVFNTPNTQSMPGYLKMGWQVQGRMPLKIQVLSPVRTAMRILLKQKAATPHSTGSAEWNGTLKHFEGREPVTAPGLHTPWSESYVRWRYIDNPLFPYHFISDNKDYLLIYRIKEHSRFTELRLTDFYIFNTGSAIKADIRQRLKAIYRSSAADLLTISARQLTAYKDHLPSFGLIPVRDAGPSVTLRDLTVTGEFDTLMKMDNWSYSMGDLELF